MGIVYRIPIGGRPISTHWRNITSKADKKIKRIEKFKYYTGLKFERGGGQRGFLVLVMPKIFWQPIM
jgi:hypothetical protein